VELIPCINVYYVYGVAQKSKLLTQYNSLLFFEPPCIFLHSWNPAITWHAS